MNPEDVLSEKSHQDKPCVILLAWGLESSHICQQRAEEGLPAPEEWDKQGTHYAMATEGGFYKMKRGPEVEGTDGCRGNVIPHNFIPKMVWI